MARRLPSGGRGVKGQGGIAAFEGSGTTHVSGLSELKKALEQLPDKLQERATKNAMAAGARVIRNEAKRLVPVDEGDLKENIVVSKTIKLKGRRRKLKSSVVVGLANEARYYGHLIEFGKHNAAPQPFLRPAFDNTHAEATRVAGQKLGKEVEKQARKLGEMSGKKRRKAFSR